MSRLSPRPFPRSRRTRLIKLATLAVVGPLAILLSFISTTWALACGLPGLVVGIFATWWSESLDWKAAQAQFEREAAAFREHHKSQER